MAREFTEVLQVRMTPSQARYLALKSAREGLRGQGAAVRSLIDAAMDSEPKIAMERGGKPTMTLRYALEHSNNEAFEDMLEAQAFDEAGEEEARRLHDDVPLKRRRR